MNKLINKIGDQNRERKYELFLKLFKPDSTTKILDAGASEKEYRATSNHLEKKYPHPENITILGVDNYKDFPLRYPEVNIVKYKGGIFPFKDKAFDICWSNAVIEHVGDQSKQELFLKEILRVSKRAFITTPNRFFILESHTKVLFFHYLPRDIFNKILSWTGNSYPGHLIHLLGLKDVKYLFDKNNISNYKIIKNKIFGLTIDFVMVIE